MLTRGRIFAGLVPIAAHHVATWLVWRLHRPLARCVVDRDFLDLKLHRVGTLTRDLDGVERAGVAQHHVANLLGAAQPRAENVEPTARLDRRNHLLRDHSGVGDQTHPTHPEATLQACSDLVEGGDVGGVARPHLAAHRDTVPVNHHPQHHLFAIAAVVLALAVVAEGVAAVAGEEQRGGVEEHQVERAEEVAASSEQFLLDEVFDAPRRGRIGLAFPERLAEPAHRAVQMLQLEPFGAVDGLVTRAAST